MPALIAFPPGWLPAALEASTSALGFGASTALGGGEASDLDSGAAWRRLKALQDGQAPRIVDFGLSYRVLDVERTEDGILHYARRVDPAGLSEPWAIFFQARLEDADCDLLVPRQIRDYLLAVYAEEDIRALPEEITYPQVESLTTAETASGTRVHEVSFQNHHLLRIAYGRDGLMPSLKGLLNYLGHIPLSALTQLDEIRMSGERNGEVGHTFREGGRLVSVIYPLGDETDVPAGTPSLKELKARHIRTLYTFLHEIFGHGLAYKNRFIRREMIKIWCSGEEAPSDYARISDEEWFPEGVAERWERVVNRDPDLGLWDRRFPYLSGLILNLLGTLEGYVAPATSNIDLGAGLMRPLGLKDD